MWRIALFISVFCLVRETDAACNFPTEMLGNWTTNNVGTVVITTSIFHTSGFSMLSDGKGTDWDCHGNEVNTEKFLLRSALTLADGGDNLHLYLCLAITQVNENSYYYYQESKKETYYQGFRLTAKLANLNSTFNLYSDVCYEGIIHPAEYHVMVREGSETSAGTDFPEEMHGKFQYTYDEGSGNMCGNTSLDICTDKTTWAVNYTICPTTVLYSSGGVAWCVASVQSGTTYYLTLYNADSVVDDTTTFRFICLVAEQNSTDSTIFLSQLQTECEAGQLPTEKPTGGALLTLTSIDPCIDPVAPTTTDNTGAIVAGVLVSLILLAALIVAAIFYWRYRKRKELERKLTRKQETQKFHPDHPMAEGAIALDVPPSFLMMKDETLPDPDNKKKNPQVARKKSEAMAAPKTLNPIAEVSLPISVDPEMVSPKKAAADIPANKKKTPRFQNSPTKAPGDKFGRKKGTAAEVENEEKLTIMHDYLTAEGTHVTSKPKSITPVEQPGLMRSKTELPVKLSSEATRKGSITARPSIISLSNTADKPTKTSAAAASAAYTPASPLKKPSGPAPSRLKFRSKTTLGATGKSKKKAKGKKSTKASKSQAKSEPTPPSLKAELEQTDIKENEKEAAERDSSGYASNPESIVSGGPDGDISLNPAGRKKQWH